jgi:hypothetical protein
MVHFKEGISVFFPEQHLHGQRQVQQNQIFQISGSPRKVTGSAFGRTKPISQPIITLGKQDFTSGSSFSWDHCDRPAGGRAVTPDLHGCAS